MSLNPKRKETALDRKLAVAEAKRIYVGGALRFMLELNEDEFIVVRRSKRTLFHEPEPPEIPQHPTNG